MLDDSSWIPVIERLPQENETIEGRVPALDSDGYLTCAMKIGDQLYCSSDLPATHWLPVPPRPAHQ